MSILSESTQTTTKMAEKNSTWLPLLFTRFSILAFNYFPYSSTVQLCLKDKKNVKGEKILEKMKK